MFSQSYTSESLQGYITMKDKLSSSKSILQLKATAEAVGRQIASGTFAFGRFKTTVLKKKRHFSPGRIADNWVLRQLNHNLVRLYKVKQANRYLIVKQVAALVREELPMTILQFDIKDFYESIDKKGILNKVVGDSLLSYHSKRLLKNLFASSGLKRHKGLPRGVCVSSTLSEIAMRDFDRVVRQLNGVYYFARYVDDIIVFAFRDPELVRIDLKKALPSGLRLNEKKSNIMVTVRTCRCNPECVCRIPKCRCLDKCKCTVNAQSMRVLEYLGYEFRFSDLAKARQLSISVSERKINKIKTRIVYAFLEHAKDSDFDLLKRRIMFLTGNHFIEQYGTRFGLKAGIYYNYPLLTDLSCLSRLDEFLRKVAFSRSNAFGRRIGRHLTIAQRRVVASHSFVFGFQNRVIHRFSGKSIREIKQCWSYEHN